MICEKLGNGKVHSTYLVKNDDGSPACVLQRINTVAFKDIDLLMNNIRVVSDFIRSKGFASVEFTEYENGKLYEVKEDGIWRKMKYINGISFDSLDDLFMIEKSGGAFGDFVSVLADFKEVLKPTIPDFHDTKKRLDNCIKAIEKDPKNRAKEASKLITYIEQTYDEICRDYELLLSCAPLRVTHNDTKINNILFDKETLEPIAVIDLDTVMPGMTLYDFGDAQRTVSLSYVPGETPVFNKEKYNAFAKGYLKKAEGVLTQKEKDNLLLATITLTKELGARFLEDYLLGDIYFNTSFERENLLRAESLLSVDKAIPLDFQDR